MDRWIVVTGGSAGIGRAAVAALIAAGRRVIVASRQPARGLPGGPALRHLPLDLSEIRTIDAGAATLAEAGIELEAIVANAGVWPRARAANAAGLELGFAVNHVGHAALIDRLGPRLVDGGRVVVVASGLHARGRIDWEDLGARRGFDPMAAYAQSKLANVMYALALARRAPRWRVNAIHPGVVATALHGSRPPGHAITATAAARAVVALAIDPAHASTTGRYFDQATARRPAPLALDRPSQERLWTVTAELIRRR